MLSFSHTIREIANQLSYEKPRVEIVMHLVRDGVTVEVAHLMVRAAELYLSWQKQSKGVVA